MRFFLWAIWLIAGVYSSGLMFAANTKEFHLCAYPMRYWNFASSMLAVVCGPIGLIATLLVYGRHNGWMNPFAAFWLRPHIESIDRRNE